MTSHRKTAVFVFAALLVGVAFPATAGEGQWTPDGLHGKQVYSLAIGAPPNTLFAATGAGAFRRTADGDWEQVLGVSTELFAVDPTNPATVYAASLQGIFRSTDNGESFERLASLPAQCLAVDPNDAATLYVGSPYAYENTTVTPGMVHKSTDGGRNWSPLDTRSLVDGIAALVLDPRRPGTVYAGAVTYFDYPGYPPAPVSAKRSVIRTEDGGAVWSAVLANAGVETRALAVDPETGGVWAGGDALFRSWNPGSLFTRIDIGLGLQIGGVRSIVIDPANPLTIYAGTIRTGVFRSVDGGANWAPMNDGLSDEPTYGNSGLWIDALTLDSEGVLRAGTQNGVFAIRPGAPGPSCTPAPEHLCLLGGRYRATIMAQHPLLPLGPKSLTIARGNVAQQGERAGAFSLPQFTGDEALPEVVVKMVDTRNGNWLFHGSLTGLPYILTVTDTETGRVETYANNAANRFCGGVDGSAFAEDPQAAPTPLDEIELASQARSIGSEGWMDPVQLSLLHGRFSVSLDAHSPRHGRYDYGVAVAVSDRSGYFSLPGFTGDSGFPEVYVKMLDFRSLGGGFLLFSTGLTSLDYTLTVTDNETGAVRSYANPGDFCGRAEALSD